MIIFSMERNWKGGGAFPVQGCARSVLLAVALCSLPHAVFLLCVCSDAGVSPGLLLACVKSPVLIAVVYVTTLNC